MVDPRIVEVHYPIKSESDKCDYRGLVLENQLRILLVSDPNTLASAAALSVHVGHFSSPIDIPGLAHFCEHMLFLGSKKYPDENAYDAFLGDSGGASNAATTYDHTRFYFDVNSDSLRSALNIFAHFFTEPLFDASCMERELNAVNSEFLNDVTDDETRESRLHQVTCDPGHDCAIFTTWNKDTLETIPKENGIDGENGVKEDSQRLSRLDDITCDQNHDVAKFGCGNKSTLKALPKENGIDVREALMEFHDKYYSSNIMNLCVLGEEILDELLEMVVEMFGGIANKNIDPPIWESPFLAEHLGVELKLVPMADLRKLSLTFPIPDMRKEYRSDPENYLSHIIGHEGKGSLLSFFRMRGWVNSLIASNVTCARGICMFEISMELSSVGSDNVDSIIEKVFQYLKMLRQEEPSEAIHDELLRIDAMDFRFSSDTNPYDYVKMLCKGMERFRWEDTLCGQCMNPEYKPELITQLLECLTPQNMRVVIVSKDFEGIADNTEQYYGFNYSIEKISEDKINLWSSCEVSEDFYLPEPNVFIPTNFDLCPEQSEYTEQPVLIIDEPSHRMWFRQDKEFLLPKLIIFLDIRNPIAYSDPLNACMTSLIEICFEDANNEYFYSADLAGLKYGLSAWDTGITVMVRGYSEKLIDMLNQVLTRLVYLEIDEDRFRVLKESYIQRMRNWNAKEPSRHCESILGEVLEEVKWTYPELLDVVEGISAVQCQTFLSELLSNLFVEGLIYGNITVEGAHEFSETIKRIQAAHTLSFEETRNLSEYMLKDGVVYEFKYINEIHPMNAMLANYQIGVREEYDFRLTALTDLFEYVISEPFYDVLRTKEQLAYSLSTFVRHSCRSIGMYFVIQSEKSPDFLMRRLEDFVNIYAKDYLSEMTEERFESNRSALVTLKEEKAKDLRSQCENDILPEILGREYIFDRNERLAYEISTIEKTELLQFFEKHILEPTARRLLIIKVVSLTNNGDDLPYESDYLISDIHHFHKDHELIDPP